MHSRAVFSARHRDILSHGKRHNATPEPATGRPVTPWLSTAAMNLPWLAFVNASFALMILLRNSLFGQIDTLLHVSPPLTQMIDASMLGVVILSVALVIMARRHIRGVSAVLLMVTCYGR